MEQKTIYQEQEDEIDLLGLLLAYKRKLWLIILVALLGGVLAGVFSKFVLIPQYNSSAMLYVLSKETTLTSLADLQIGSQLSKDYSVIIRTRPVLQEVVDKLELDMTYKDLRGKLKITNDADTRILTLTITDPDPELAKLIVDQVANSASDYIGDIMEMIPPKLIEDGEIPLYPVSPNNKRNAVLGALAGIVLVCGVITVGVLLDDTVKTEDDVERYLGLTVLVSIPDRAKTKGNQHIHKHKGSKGKKEKKPGKKKKDTREMVGR